MILSLAFILGVSSCLRALDTDSSEVSTQSLETCVNDDTCQAKNTECYDKMCLCRPGLFTTSDRSCLSKCNLLDLEDIFVVYSNSNIRGVNSFGLTNESTVQECTDRCVKISTCLTFDYRASDGLCQLHTVTASSVPSNWHPKTKPNWTHFQRMCRSPGTYNTTCSSDGDCSRIKGVCLSGRCQCAPNEFFDQNHSSCRINFVQTL